MDVPDNPIHMSASGTALAGFLLSVGLPASGAGFRASVVKMDITPDRSEWLKISAFQQVVQTTDPIPSVTVKLEQNAVLSGFVRAAMIA